MEELISGVIYILFMVGVVKILRKTVWKNSSSKGTTTGSFSANGTMPTITSQPTFTTQQVRPAQSSAMPHVHKPANQYETYSKKTHNRQSGAMPHKHEKGHYTSMADASKLPPGYILLNGEPVRVADLEGK